MIREKYIQTKKETCINIVNSKVESIRLKNDTKTSLRIYKDGCIAVAGAIGSYQPEQLEKEAIEALTQRIPCPWEPTVNRKEKMSKKAKVMDNERLADEVEMLLSVMTERHPDFIFSYKAFLEETSASLTNDLGLKLEYEDEVISMEYIFKEKSSTSIMDGFVQFSDRSYDREKVLDIVDNTLNAYRNKIELPMEGKYPVVFSEYELPIMKFRTDLNAHQFAAGSSIFSGRKGEKIFHENFTFYQTRNPDDIFSVPFFDAEGTVNHNYRYPLIENGVIVGPYTDKRTANKYKLPLTGSAGAAYDGVPELSLIGYKISESEKSLKELLNGQMGIFVIMAGGGDFTPTGEFASPVQLAMLFDGERYVGRLPELRISSNIYDMFGKDYRGVGKDKLTLNSYGRCAVLDMNISRLY